MKVYLAPDGLWHVRVNSHELRQHYFTEKSAIAAGSACVSQYVIDAMADGGNDANAR